jgi:hypothetical protein
MAGEVSFILPKNSAMIIVAIPGGSTIETVDDKIVVNEIVVAYK